MINSWLQVALLSLMLASLVQANPQTKAGATLNLNNVDIRTLIETVALLTRKHFIIDPRVQGQVTVVSNTPVADHEIYEVFLAVLDVHSFIAAPTGNSIKIMPKVNSRMVGAYDDASTGQPQDAIVTRGGQYGPCICCTSHPHHPASAAQGSSSSSLYPQ